MVKVTRSKILVWMEGLLARNVHVHVKHESPTSKGSKVMVKV